MATLEDWTKAHRSWVDDFVLSLRSAGATSEEIADRLSAVHAQCDDVDRVGRALTVPLATARGDELVVEHGAHVRVGVVRGRDLVPLAMDLGEGLLEEVLGVGVVAGDEIGQPEQLLATLGHEGLEGQGRDILIDEDDGFEGSARRRVTPPSTDRHCRHTSLDALTP